MRSFRDELYKLLQKHNKRVCMLCLIREMKMITVLCEWEVHHDNVKPEECENHGTN